MNAEHRNIDVDDDDEDDMPLVDREAGRLARGWQRLTQLPRRIGFHYSFTTITGRILTLNVLSLVILFVGLVYLSDFRDSLTDARMRSLVAQADIIANSIAHNATDTATDPLATLQKGETLAPRIEQTVATQTMLSLVQPTETRGLIYDADGTVIVDSNKPQVGTELSLYKQAEQRNENGFFYRWWLRAERVMHGQVLPEYKRDAANRPRELSEVQTALAGSGSKMVRLTRAGETVLSVAAPIKVATSSAKEDAPKTVIGALLLITPEGQIDGLLAKERSTVLQVWALVFGVTVFFSFLQAGTIAGPIHRLAVAAEKVRANIKKRAEIPDFTHRKDEIGELSTALREMTSALYKRLDAIESFAADVAHELKNPLTSLRSATETLSIVRNSEDRDRLVQIIQHDVKRLNRLITDISDASRLDAELAREGRRPVNVARLLDTLCSVVNDIHREGVPKIEMQISGMPRGVAITSRNAFRVNGHESRLGQVINNLIDNAISFSPPNGKILITCRHIRRPNEVEITVEDEGPGIRPENLERIFERFYTDRPSDEEFGQNSGLGLNISRQIVAAHGGRIWAENRVAPPSKESVGQKPGISVMPVLGARFVIRLPAL
jgi:two-component system, OmpR family, sensor histidine kinase ChvG